MRRSAVDPAPSVLTERLSHRRARPLDRMARCTRVLYTRDDGSFVIATPWLIPLHRLGGKARPDRRHLRRRSCRGCVPLGADASGQWSLRMGLPWPMYPATPVWQSLRWNGALAPVPT